MEDLEAAPGVAAKVAADIPRYLVPVAVSEQSDDELAQKQVAVLTKAAAPVAVAAGAA